MPASFHIGVIPNRPLAEFVDWVSLADSLGFEGVWVADSQSVFRDAFMALTMFAGATRRMKLATGVTNPITRHPAVLAGSFATLDEISGGRAILGIGVGESAVETIGVKAAKLGRLEEFTRVLRALMAGETVDFDGQDIRVSWPPRPVPIVYACSGPKSLRLAGRVADGVLFQVGAEPALARWALRHVEEGARAAGRRLSDVRLYQRLACAVSDDRARVRNEVKGYAAVAAGTIYRTLPREDVPEDLWEELRHMKAHYDYHQHADAKARHAELITDRILDAVAIAGTPEEAVPRFRALAALGVEAFVMPVTIEQPASMIRMLAERVIPQVNA
jgi:5,10-methylenetetrahydromethanopterin reductase